MKNTAAHDLGTNPDNLPTWVKFTVPFAAVESQLGQSVVKLPFEVILDGLDPQIRGIFNKARPGLQIEVPANDVFHALPAPGKDAPARDFASQLGSQFAEKFIPPAFIAPAPVAEPPAPAVFIPANPVTGLDAFVAPAPNPPAASPVAAPAVTHDSTTTRRLMLAVLLGTPDAADVPTVVRLTRALPGTSAVVCLKDDQVLAESHDGSPEAERFVRLLPEKLRSVTEIGAFFGDSSSTPETVHLQLDRGQMTVSLQGNVTFAALYHPSQGDPVLREKITLLGREIASLIRDQAPR